MEKRARFRDYGEDGERFAEKRIWGFPYYADDGDRERFIEFLGQTTTNNQQDVDTIHAS
jgi:hypothetical protein